MRIALFSPLPPEASGIADYADLFRNELERAGITVEAPIPGGQWPAKAGDLERLARSLDLGGYDLIHFELGGGRIRPFLMLRILLYLHPDKIFTATVHDPERLAWRAWGMAKFERLPRRVQQVLTVLTNPISLARERQVAGRLAAMVTLTRHGADALASRMCVDRRRVHTIPHGVMLVPQTELPSLKRVRFLFFGYIFPGKGIEGLLEALVLLRQRNEAVFSDVHLTIAGGSSPSMMLRGQTDYLGQLRQLVDELGLNESVGFETDLPEARLPELIQAHHAMILPYEDSRKLSLLGRYLGSSGAAAWAIASGRGLLVTDARCMPEEIEAGNGVFFLQRNPAALADLLEQIVGNRECIEDWAACAKQLAITRSWQNVCQQFVRVFKASIQKSW